MATVAQTISSLELVRAQEHRPTEREQRWAAVESRLATLQDGGGTVVDVQILLLALKRKRKRPTLHGPQWDAVSKAIGTLTDAP